MIDGNPLLEEILENGKLIDAEFAQRREFIRKQIDTVNKGHEARAEAFWSNVEVQLRKAGILPLDYDPSKGHHVTFDPGLTALQVCYWHEEFPGIAFELPL